MRRGGQADSMDRRWAARGFTLMEVLVTLLILSALALLSYRGLDTVLTARDRVTTQTDKWLQLNAFMTRFKQDVQVAAPYPVRSVGGSLPAWLGRDPAQTTAQVQSPALEFSRFASIEGQDRIRRVAYRLNADGDLELWLWPGLDTAVEPTRYAVLHEVVRAEFAYMNAQLLWVSAWPLQALDATLPRAVRLTLELRSGEVFVRVIALGT